MNSISPFYKKYDTISKLAYDLNDSVITLKCKSYMESEKKNNRYPDFRVGETQVLKAKYQLMGVLALLESFYKKKDSNNILYELIDNSAFVRQILNNSYIKRLAALSEKLKNEKELSGKDFSIVDQLISILNNGEPSYENMRNRR